MRLKPLAAAALLVVSASSALADVYNFTMPVDPASPYSLGPLSRTGLFTDKFIFTFPTSPLAQAASAQVVQTLLSPTRNISNFTFALYTSAGNTLVGGATGSGGNLGSLSLNNTLLTAGTEYYYLVTGNANGTSGGTYTFGALASPVPEPGTYALFLAGLAAVGFVARRRAPAGAMAAA